MLVPGNNVAFNNVSFNNGSFNNVSISDDPWAYVPILYATLLSPIIVFGIVGNVLSILVWNKGKRRRTTTSRYMSALAVADILVLSISGSYVWLDSVLQIKITGNSLTECQAALYCFFVLRVISAWILVVATVERAMRILMPHRVRLSCRPNIAVVIIALVCGLISVAYLPFYTGIQFDDQNGSEVCTYETSSLLGKNVYAFLVFDLCMFFAGPFSIIIVCNMSILFKIIKSKQNVQARGGQTTGNRGSQHKTMTWRIIILSLTFCFCIAPYSIIFILILTSPHPAMIVPAQVSLIIMFLNNGMNFIVYCVIGSGFRKDLKTICKCR